MRRIVCTEYGAPEALSVVEEDAPRPSAGKVLIETHTVGVSFVDSLTVQGAYRVKPPLPFTTGNQSRSPSRLQFHPKSATRSVYRTPHRTML